MNLENVVSQSVFLLIEANPNPNQKEALQDYLTKAPAITAEHGAVLVARYNIETALDGGEKSALFAVMSFPDRQAVDNLFNDPKYKALIPSRDLGFSSIRFFIGTEKI